MQYLRLVFNNTNIELHNHWTGKETVIVGGNIVSSGYSTLGMDHRFSITEAGKHVEYVLTTKILDNLMTVGVDLKCNDVMIYENVKLPYGSKPKSPAQELKKQALAKLLDYDMVDALATLKKAQHVDPGDPEIYFHMACAYSNLEDTDNGFLCLKKAVECGLADLESIMNHDMLAYLRIQEPFESFSQSGFKRYKPVKINK